MIQLIDLSTRLPSYQRALVALMYLHKRDPLAQTVAGFGISVGTAHAYTTAVIDLLATQAPGLLRVLREHEPHYALLDGTLAECDRVSDGRADCSHEHCRHGVNVQVVTDPTGQVLHISPTLPGRCHDPTAARTHRILRICERQASPSRPTAPTWVPTPGSPPDADAHQAGIRPDRTDGQPDTGHAPIARRT